MGGGNELPTPEYNVILLNEETGTVSVKKPEPTPNIILTYADGHQYKDYTSVVMTYRLIEDKSTLVSAVLNEGVQIISSNTFYNCSNLTSVTMPDSVVVIGDEAFKKCEKLKSITIGGGVKTIGYSAFCETNLSSIIIPDNVININAGAFRKCENLETIVIGSGVTNIGYRNDLDIFRECPSIKHLSYYSSVPLDERFTYDSNNIETVIIGDLTTSIGRTFSGQTHLTLIKIGSGVTKLDYSALQGCTSLTSVGLKGSNSSVELPNTIADIPNNLFNGCTNITSVTIPDSVITAQTYSFSFMDNVETIDLGNSLQILAGYNFYNDVKLKSVHLPKTITYIGQSVFFNCPSLTDINYDGTVEEWNQININSNWFYNLPQTSVIHCTDGDIPLYA